MHGNADEAYGNHRIPAWSKGKRIQALIPHIGSKKKCQKSLIAHFRQYRRIATRRRRPALPLGGVTLAPQNGFDPEGDSGAQRRELLLEALIAAQDVASAIYDRSALRNEAGHNEGRSAP